MKIGYLVPEFPGQTHIMFWREIRALRQIGEDVVILSTRRPSSPCPHAFAAEAIAETCYFYPPSISRLSRWVAAGVPGVSQAFAYLKDLGATGVKNRARHCVLLASAADVARWARDQKINHIHGHSCADAAHVLALAQRLGGPSYSLTLHGDLGVYGSDHQSKMRSAAFVGTVGRHLRLQVEDRVGLPSDRIVETFMGVDVSAAHRPAADRSREPGRLRLVTVAQLHPAKGHAHAIAAIHRGVRNGLDLRYTIIGNGPNRDALLELTSKLGMQDRITFTGALSEDAVFDTLSKSDVFVLPSIGVGEAWPVSIMEAMSASLPVVATDIGATSQIITSGRDGFLVPQADEEALLKVFTLLANDLELRRQIAEAGRTTAREKFDVSVSARRLRDAIRAALTEGRPDVVCA